MTAACKAPRPPQSPAQPVEGESFVPPFEAEHPYRGPGLVLYGMRLVGERGACQLSITAFDHGRDIVFDVTKSRETPADWLDACPRSVNDPREHRIEVSLEGAEEAKSDAVSSGDGAWWTSIDVAHYARLRTIRMTVCGNVYTLPSAHNERVAQHARLASERAARKNQEEAALPRACEAGNGASCVELGALRNDPREQRLLYERACALRDVRGCSRFADMMLQGRGGERNPEEALRLFRDSCRNGYDGACLGASRAIISRPSAQPTSGAEGRFKEGAELARRACELSGSTAAVSCLRAAELYATGFGVPADPVLVARFADRSCGEKYDRACQLRRDLVACAQGLGDACAGLAEAARKSRHRAIKDDGTEASWRLAACNRGHADSCGIRPR